MTGTNIFAHHFIFKKTAALIEAFLGRCHIQECDAAEPEFNPSWLLSAIPGQSINTGDFDQCNRFVNINSTTTFDNGAEEVCPAHWFNQDQQKSCERHLYENTNTVVYDVSAVYS